ncbi:serine/threonine-protein phosphatase 4 regulatory subunit 2-like isoform X2 [Aphidius gifuensis]|uniref:serine/threonine-protein phosphatase 4 regulatory subunit 2-like isoform X2 n=1 Tax=Aphidius gifuensis TaxID=684658 RepID=UPI001CDC1FAC|nr:serine/threonine-protein phosphatase 4 regulatory subunit 2-like isoform X2 [Aphidius gifuensis]
MRLFDNTFKGKYKMNCGRVNRRNNRRRVGLWRRLLERNLWVRYHAMSRLEQEELEERSSREATVPVAANQDNTGDDDPAARLEQEELEQRLSGEPTVPVADNPDNTGDESNGSAMDHEIISVIDLVSDDDDDEPIYLTRDTREQEYDDDDDEPIYLTRDTREQEYDDIDDDEPIYLTRDTREQEYDDDDDDDDADTVILEPEEMNRRLENVDYYNCSYIPRVLSRRVVNKKCDEVASSQ